MWTLANFIIALLIVAGWGVAYCMQRNNRIMSERSSLIKEKNKLLAKIEEVSRRVWMAHPSDGNLNAREIAVRLISQTERVKKIYVDLGKIDKKLCPLKNKMQPLDKIQCLRTLATLDIERDKTEEDKKAREEKVSKISEIITELEETPQDKW